MQQFPKEGVCDSQIK